jgi:hypothetical protein
MPILGVTASSRRVAAPATGAYDSIATFTLTNNSSSIIEFSSLPTNYTHLQIRGIGAGITNTNVRMRFNNDSSNNYSFHAVQAGAGYGSTCTVTSGANNSSMIMYDQQLGSSTQFNIFVSDILEYRSTTKNKSVRTLSGATALGSTNGFVYLYSGNWFASPTPITSIQIYPFSNEFYAGSSFALYGIKGA